MKIRTATLACLLSIGPLAVTTASAEPDKATPVRNWTPEDQWTATASKYGYTFRYGAIVLADDLGDRISQLGRVRLVEGCFENAFANSVALAWAICGADVRAIKLSEVEAELAKTSLPKNEQENALKKAQRIVEQAQAYGAAVEATAKTEAGVREILALGPAAATEWTAFASAHSAELALLDTLQDAARANKDNPVPDCLAKTKPAFAKVVRSAKLSGDVDGHAMEFFVAQLPHTTESYLATLSYGACAYLSAPDSGGTMYAAAGNGPTGSARRGPRSLALAKTFEPSFKPKLPKETMDLGVMQSAMDGGVEVQGRGPFSYRMTSADGDVAVMTKEGDITKISFKGNTVDACVDWREVRGEKVCKKRAQVANQETATEIATVFADGIKRGSHVSVIAKFPAAVWTGDKLTAVLGVTLK